MHQVDQIYIDGAFISPHGVEVADIHNPSTGEVIGQVRFADAVDTAAAIAAAKRAFPAFSKTTKEQRIAWLEALADALQARSDDLMQATIEEYGAPVTGSSWMVDYAVGAFRLAASTLESYEFTRLLGSATVTMEPLGIVGVITPWNSNAIFIANKLAMVIASGSTCVIKPSELSARQTQIVTEALHEAGLPKGVFNIVTGRGDIVGEAISTSPDIAKISFTGSSATGRAILRAGAETFKRFTLELGGKSPTIVLDDADFARAIPVALGTGFFNNGQACVAGTRILVPRARLAEFERGVEAAMGYFKAGVALDPTTRIGPVINQRQWDRIQSYIRKGKEEGAHVLAGGEGRPEGTEGGWLVRPTIFTEVDNGMTIAREEIFGPVLSIIAYDDENDAVAIANDSSYGLHAYVLGENLGRARAVANRLEAGRVVINGGEIEHNAPFGGFKQSGIGRENGTMGLEAFLEPRAVMG